tara:strand:+ start:66 stop:644 length:579 start_codon:yes stop_codon:yes gene_type:complete
MKRKFMVVENFFGNFEQIKDEFKEIPRYSYYNHPFIKPKLEEMKEKQKETGQGYFWPGARSEDLKKGNRFLTALFLKEFEHKMGGFFHEKLSFMIYTHLRLDNDKAQDFPHKDSPDSIYSLLVYLSDTNLKSGTRLYDDVGNEVADIKFVQNRAIIFSSEYTHEAINNHGTDQNNGRLTLNVFWNDRNNMEN